MKYATLVDMTKPTTEDDILLDPPSIPEDASMSSEEVQRARMIAKKRSLRASIPDEGSLGKRQRMAHVQVLADSERIEAQNDLQTREDFRTHRARQQNQQQNTEFAAILRGAQSVLSTVASSWKKQTNITMTASSSWGGQADLRTNRIDISAPLTGLGVQAETGTITGNVKKFVTRLLALGYHEVGHLLYSMPSHDGLTIPVDAREVRAWWSSSVLAVLPRAATSPMAGDMVSDGGNLPTKVDIPTLLRDTSSNVRSTWNVLEDQRMESFLAEESPVIGSYFRQEIPYLLANNRVTDHTPDDVLIQPGEEMAEWEERVSSQILMELWPLLVGRLYLPKYARDAARGPFKYKLRRYGVGHTIPDSEIDLVLHLTEESILEYVTASTTEEMMLALCKAHICLQTINSHLESGSSDDVSALPTKLENSRVGSGGGQRDFVASHEDAQEREEALKQASEILVEAVSNESWGSGYSESVEENTNDGHAAEEHIVSAEDIEQVLKDFTKEVISTMDSSSLIHSPLSYTDPLEQDSVDRAEDLAHDLVRALEVNTSSLRESGMQRFQTRGTIDPIAYVSKAPGTNRFRKGMVQNTKMGADLGLSLLLDISGSMIPECVDLSVMNHAFQVAAKKVGVEIEVTGFNSGVVTIQDRASYPADPVLLKPGGGTDPTSALKQLNSQFNDKETHLVILMTDGSFDIKDEIPFVTAPSICFVYKNEGVREHLLHHLPQIGFDTVLLIDDLEEMLEGFESFVLQYANL